MTAVAKSYSLLRRLTVAFSIVALLAFALVGGFLYNALALELQRRDDMEIAEKLDQFLQQARDFGSTQAVVQHSVVFHEVLQSHPDVFLIPLRQARRYAGAAFHHAYSRVELCRAGASLSTRGVFM